MHTFFSHATQKTAWDHPKYRVAMEMIEECNNIKYAAYRTAAKLNILQKTLCCKYIFTYSGGGLFFSKLPRLLESKLGF